MLRYTRFSAPSAPTESDAVLEHARRPDGVGRLETAAQRAVLQVVVELMIVQAAAGERFLAPSLRFEQPRQQVDRPRSSSAGC